MKNITSIALFGAITVTAQAAVTDPVGYITHTINNKGTDATRLTIIGPSLVQPSSYVGTSTASPSGGTVISLPDGVPAGLDAGDVLEITTGASEGWWSTVTSSDDAADTITVNDAFPAGLPANTDVAVRPHNTVLSFLGANNPGLKDASGGIPSADVVQILTPAQTLTSIIYATEAQGDSIDGNGAGWFFTAPISRADDAVIHPGEGVLIKTDSAVDLVFNSTGEVKTTKTDIDFYGVAPGATLTLVTQPDAVGATLGDTGFGDDFIQATSPSSPFDKLQFLNADQSLTTYGAAAAGTPLGAGVPFLASDFSDASAVVWPEGVGAIVRREAVNGTDGVMNVNGSTVAP